ncbi:MAG: phasin family protein [Gammaproteobacteria bacterium]|jgi:phasin family protein
MNAQFEKFVEPIKEINALSIKNIETVSNLQLRAVEENARIGIAQVKGATAVKDADDWKSYLSTQAELSQQFSDSLVENTRTLVELGNAYTNELQRIAKDMFAVK